MARQDRTTVPAMASMHALAAGLSAWLADGARPGHANAGVIIDDDAVTVVDTLTTPGRAAPLAAELEPLEIPVRRVVLTSSHTEYSGGTTAFPLAAVYGTAQISSHLDLPPNVEGVGRLYPDLEPELRELVTRPVSHVVQEPAWLSPTAIAVPVTGQLAENLVVQVPAAGTVFAGAMCSFGVTPLAFDGDPLAWADALDRVLELGSVIVPGHGPVGGEAEVRIQQAYLRACAEANGDPAALPSGDWDDWPGQAFHAVNVERAARLAAGDDAVPTTMLALLGLT